MRRSTRSFNATPSTACDTLQSPAPATQGQATLSSRLRGAEKRQTYDVRGRAKWPHRSRRARAEIDRVEAGGPVVRHVHDAGTRVRGHIISRCQARSAEDRTRTRCCIDVNQIAIAVNPIERSVVPETQGIDSVLTDGADVGGGPRDGISLQTATVGRCPELPPHRGVSVRTCTNRWFH
jgi:hypothetical protein